MEVTAVRKNLLFSGVFGKFQCYINNVTFGELNKDFLVFDRGDSVAVLLVNTKGTHGLFVEQFRYPAYINGEKESLFEVVAGTVEKGREQDEVAVSEIFEETGVHVRELEYVSSIYPSPGASTERIHLYFGVYDKKVQDEAGLEEHSEKTIIKELPLKHAVGRCVSGEIEDAKTMILILLYLIKRDLFVK